MQAWGSMAKISGEILLSTDGGLTPSECDGLTDGGGSGVDYDCLRNVTNTDACNMTNSNMGNECVGDLGISITVNITLEEGEIEESKVSEKYTVDCTRNLTNNDASATNDDMANECMGDLGNCMNECMGPGKLHE